MTKSWPKRIWYALLIISVFLAMLMVTGCGNTISGIGKDIQDGGQRPTAILKISDLQHKN